MARPIILSNNELQVGLSYHGEVSDVYFPYVGLENHTIGGNTRHRVGVWADGRVSWLSDDGWSCKFSYHHEALIGHIVAVNEQIGIMLEFDDAVDTDFKGKGRQGKQHMATRHQEHASRHHGGRMNERAHLEVLVGGHDERVYVC